MGYRINSDRAIQFRRWITTMEDWKVKIDKFLLADDLDVFENAGKISHEIACDKALTEI